MAARPTKRFEILDHTADAILRAHGRGLGDLFENAALGMFSIVGEPGNAAPAVEREVSVSAEDRESLLVAWLSELLFLFETTEIFFGEFECRVADNAVRAVVRGERFDPVRHGFKTEIKAVTRHRLSVARQGGRWVATVLFDL